MSSAELVNEVKNVLGDRDESLAVVQAGSGELASTVLRERGVSGFFCSGAVVYSYDAKLRYGVSRETLDSYGAVSREVVRELARRARDRNGVDWGLSSSCIAGPAGGEDEKPVGTTYIGVSYKGELGTQESYTAASQLVLDGDRKEIQRDVAVAALKFLLEKTDET